MKPLFLRSLVMLTVALVACQSDDDSTPTASGPSLRIVTTSGAPLSAVAGDALPLKIVKVESDGTVSDLPVGATFEWTSPGKLKALPPETVAPDLLNPTVPGDGPIGTWLDNPSRTDRDANLTNLLFVLAPGTIQNGTLHVAASVTNVPGLTDVSAEVQVSPAPMGDARRGAATYATNCAACHGATGHGSPASADGKSFTLEGKSYDFPAPGLNAESGNVASDDGWTPALFAFSSRSDVDNAGVALRQPMPDWFAIPNPGSGKSLSTQDFADVFAYLRTQDR
jgi:cytochrome c553